MSGDLVVRPVGRRALLVELPDADRAGALHAELLRRRAAGTLPPVAEIVPGARTVLLDGVPEPEALARRIADWDVPSAPPADGDVVTVPVVYDGPDLADVAALWGVAEDEVAALHSSFTYRVAFCGFAPGFGYLTGLPAELHVPRRATPRTRVPAGSVALAGPYSAVYPRATPGGWQIIGTMPDPRPLWDPSRERAALLSPGTRVRYQPLPRGSAPDPAPRSPEGLERSGPAGAPSGARGTARATTTHPQSTADRSSDGEGR